MAKPKEVFPVSNNSKNIISDSTINNLNDFLDFIQSIISNSPLPLTVWDVVQKLNLLGEEDSYKFVKDLIEKVAIRGTQNPEDQICYAFTHGRGYTTLKHIKDKPALYRCAAYFNVFPSGLLLSSSVDYILENEKDKPELNPGKLKADYWKKEIEKGQIKC